ncbi:MAG: hemerythrin domain-containing protein [Alphaproteobacteria bacterium]
MAELIRLLRRDHGNLAALLDVLGRQTALLVDGGERAAGPEGGGPDYALMESVLDYCGAFADEAHHPREDMIYARLRELDGDIADAGSDLQAEHGELSALTRHCLEAIREVRFGGGVSRERVGGLLRDFLSAYRRHMEQEETILFAAAAERLAAEDWAEIDARVAGGGGGSDDPLFGEKVEKRYQALRDYIHALDRIDAEG